jgi:hypothetical protein
MTRRNQSASSSWTQRFGAARRASDRALLQALEAQISDEAASSLTKLERPSPELSAGQSNRRPANDPF